MRYVLNIANRSTINESNSKEVYGCITAENSDIVVCYVPNARQAEKVLIALNHFPFNGSEIRKMANNTKDEFKRSALLEIADEMAKVKQKQTTKG